MKCERCCVNEKVRFRVRTEFTNIKVCRRCAIVAQTLGIPVSTLQVARRPLRGSDRWARNGSRLLSR